MTKTLCKVSSSTGKMFYLIQNNQNNLEMITSSEDIPTLYKTTVLISDINNKYQNNLGEKFLSGEIFNDTNCAVLCNGKKIESLKDLLEKEFKIPQHQMPNLPNNNQHNQQDQNVVNNNPNVLMDMNTLLYGNEYHNEYANSDFTFVEMPSELNNGQAIDYSKHVGETTYYYS